MQCKLGSIADVFDSLFALFHWNRRCCASHSIAQHAYKDASLCKTSSTETMSPPRRWCQRCGCAQETHHKLLSRIRSNPASHSSGTKVP